jgi:secreted Zn-dependent insulinase-like peptidase
LPSEEQNLSNAGPNSFIPKKVPEKVPGFEKAEKPGVPKRLESKMGQTIWFKQDDTFEQPFVWTRVLINTIDCGFTSDVNAEIFFRFWVNTFN